MTCPGKNLIGKQSPTEYATCVDFRSLFAERIDDLYQLSLVLTGDHDKAEQCFVAGLEDCVRENRVFKDWVHCWAKRTIIQNAIRDLKPRLGIATSLSFRVPTYIHDSQSDGNRHFELAAVLLLEDFERFVFVMSVLERYPEHECALLLGCTRREIEPARTRALAKLAESLRTGLFGQIYFEDVHAIVKNSGCSLRGVS